MYTSKLSRRFTSYSKLAKLNIFLLTLVLLAASLSFSFATGTSTPPDCGAHVALVLDRSSSIGVDMYSGSRAQSVANIAAIKNGANAFVDSIIGPDSYTDVYTFASVAQRVNTGGWFNVKDQESANWQKLFIGGLRFKQGATSSSEDAYDDGMKAGSEGLTNWEGALQLVGSTRQDPFPTAIVFFTDGNPTVTQAQTQQALAAGGTYAGAGIKNVDGVDAEDIAAAVRSADFLRAIGIKIIPVGVGAEGILNRANLQALAGPGNPIFVAPDYTQLEAKFREAAANICEKPARSSVNVSAVDEQGNLLAVPVNVGTTGTINGPGPNGENKTTSATTQDPWGAASWAFDTTGNWRARITNTSVPQGYEPVRDFCRRDNWNGPGAVDLPQVEGTDKDPSGAILDPLAKGGTIYCQFVLKKLSDGIQLTKDVTPKVAKRGEAVTYSFVVKNTGSTKLTNIVINDPMLGGKVGEVASLEPGASSSVITKTYTIPNDATGTIHNTATATGTPVNPDGSTRPDVKSDASADVKVELRQGQQIEKTVTPSVAQVGTEVTYTISVKNTGETSLANVVVSDKTLNKEITIAGPIEPGKTGTAQVKYTIKDGDFKDGVFTNTACIKDTQTCDDAKVYQPKVELTKSGPANARPGDKVTYTFKVKNTGIVDLTNVVVKDDTLSKYTKEPVSIKIPGTIKAGESSDVVTYNFTIPSDFKDGVFHNVAVVHANPIDPDTQKPVTTTDVTAQDSHDIAMISWKAVKTADKKVVVPGSEVTYTITVTNTGGAALNNIAISDPTIGFPKDGKPVVIDSLAPGESKSVTAKYTIPVDIKGNTFKNVALVCIPTGKTNPNTTSTSSSTTSSTTSTSSSSTTTTTKPSGPKADEDCQEPTTTVNIARIDITKTADKAIAYPGSKVVYTFVVTNNGGVTLDPTPVVDDILGEIGDPGVLEPGESQTFTKEYTVPADAKDSSKIHNTATVCAPISSDTKPTLTDKDCQTQCPKDSLDVVCAQDDHNLLVAIPSIKIDKTADKETANVGDTVTYTFTVTNTSKVDLKNIKVTDNVLGDLGTIEKLGVGESVKKTVTYVVPDSAATVGTVRNVATACFEDPAYKPNNCSSDDHTLTVTAVAGQQVTRPPAQSLPFTGSPSAWLATIAGILIAAGGALYFFTRRRRNDAV